MEKKDALSIVFACAQEYEKNLAGYNLLFVCVGKDKAVHTLEVSFDGSSFKHLTGFKSKLDANHFYQLCLRKRLQTEDFDFAADGTTPLKLKVLPKLVQKNLSANMVGDYNHSRPLLYTEKVSGSVSACMGFTRSGGKGRFVPNTVLEGDIRQLIHSPMRILITYRKERSDSKYSEIVYAAKKVDWSTFTLPEGYDDLPLPQAADC